MKVAASAEFWHRRMGHINPVGLETLNKAEGSNAKFDASISWCKLCAVEKSKHIGNPEKSIRDVNAPFQLIYASLVELTSLAILGRFRYIINITATHAKCKKVYVIKSK